MEAKGICCPCCGMLPLEEKRIAALEAELLKVEGAYREQGFTLLKVIKERDDYKRRWKELHACAEENVRLRKLIQQHTDGLIDCGELYEAALAETEGE